MSEYIDDESGDPQVLYKGRWVERKYFRAYVYNAEGEKLANSYKEFSDLIASGLWFVSKDDVSPKQTIPFSRKRKVKDGADSEGVCL